MSPKKKRTTTARQKKRGVKRGQKERTAAEESKLVAEMEELKNHLTGDANWSKQKAKDKRWHELYHGENAVQMLKRTDEMLVNPDNFIVHNNWAREIVDFFTGMHNVHPQHTFDPPGIGQARKDRAEDLEAMANEMPAVQDYEQGGDTNFMVGHETQLFAYTGRAIMPDPSIWHGKYPKATDADGKPVDPATYLKSLQEFEGNAPIPIVDWHIPAQTWYPILDGRKVIKSVEIKKVPIIVINSRYDVDLPYDSPTEEAELITTIDDEFVRLYVYNLKGEDQNRAFQDQLVYEWEHHMPTDDGTAPVVLYEGFTTSDQRPGYRWASVLEPIYDACVQLDFVASREALMTAIYYNLTIIETVDKEGALLDQTFESGIDEKFLIGAANRFPRGRNVDPLQMPRDIEWPRNLRQAMQARIDSLLPPTLRGEISSASSGYLFNQAMSQAELRQSPLATRTATADSHTTRLRFMAIGALAEISGDKNFKVTVHRRTDRGTEAVSATWPEVKDSLRLIKTKREAQKVVDILAKLQAASEAHEFGFSWETAVEDFIGKPDPAKERTKRLAEDMENSPEMLGKTKQEIMARLQVTVDEEDGIAIEDIDPSLLPPGAAQALGLEQPVAAPAGPGIADPLATAAQVLPSDAGPVSPPAVKRTRRNPRAGQRSRPGGARKRGGSGNARGASA